MSALIYLILISPFLLTIAEFFEKLLQNIEL